MVTCHIKIDVNFERFGIFVVESGLSLTANRSVCQFFFELPLNNAFLA